MSLVVTGAVVVRLAEVTEGDRTIGCSDDVREANVFGALGEHVSATNAALGLHEPCALQHEKDLLEVGLGKTGAGGDVAHRGWTGVIAVEGQ